MNSTLNRSATSLQYDHSPSTSTLANVCRMIAGDTLGNLRFKTAPPKNADTDIQAQLPTSKSQTQGWCHSRASLNMVRRPKRNGASLFGVIAGHYQCPNTALNEQQLFFPNYRPRVGFEHLIPTNSSFRFIKWNRTSYNRSNTNFSKWLLLSHSRYSRRETHKPLKNPSHSKNKRENNNYNTSTADEILTLVLQQRHKKLELRKSHKGVKSK